MGALKAGSPERSLEDYEDVERYSSMGFMELLSLQHTRSSYSLFDLIRQPDVSLPPLFQSPAPGDLSNNVSCPATSVSPSTSDAANNTETSDSMLKPKKIIRKRQSAPRFAFITKSAVDHLEDGYKWRKYGQKSVKNSPFPRSYYRCTYSSCNVKKRVERSMNDAATVVTTYEGQHTHPYPPSVRSESAFPSPERTLCSAVHTQGTRSTAEVPCGRDEDLDFGLQTPLSKSQWKGVCEDGLLQDILPQEFHRL